MKPKWLYEASPFMYVLVGLFSAIQLYNIGRWSGVLLVIAGLHIFKLRLEYRDLLNQRRNK